MPEHDSKLAAFYFPTEDKTTKKCPCTLCPLQISNYPANQATHLRNKHPNEVAAFFANMDKNKIMSGFQDLGFIVPTSVICERFFSQAKNVLTENRRSMEEDHFEMALKLKVNSFYWTVPIIDRFVMKFQEQEDDQEDK